MFITGWSSPAAAHIPHGCDGLARAGGQPGGGETEHGMVSEYGQYVKTKCENRSFLKYQSLFPMSIFSR